MKTCLRAALDNGQPGRLLDLSFVSDDHEFGPSPDGTEIHIPGRGEFTVTRGTPYEKTAPEPPALNGIPFSEAAATEDGYVTHRPPSPDDEKPAGGISLATLAEIDVGIRGTMARDVLWRDPPPLADGCDHDLRLLPVIEPRQTVMCRNCGGLDAGVSAEIGANPMAFIVHEDRHLSRRIELRRRTPEEARAYLAGLDLPGEVKALIEETLEP